MISRNKFLKRLMSLVLVIGLLCVTGLLLGSHPAALGAHRHLQ